VNSKCIAIEDEMDVSPLNMGMIAAYYNISYVTIEVFSMSLRERTKLKGLLEIVSSSSEFETIPIRRHEDAILRRIYDRVPVKLEVVNYEAPHFKTFLLLQAHFSRLQLPPDLASDQIIVLGKVLNLLAACVDVMSSNSFLNALGAMDLSQMCVQGVWDTDSPLKQIPHFSSEVIERCKEKGVESVVDIMELEDQERNDLLQMDQRSMRDVAIFVNSYPNLDVSHEFQGQDYTAGSPMVLVVNLERETDEDEDEDDQRVIAPLYPLSKMVNWWVVVGDSSAKKLHAIRKVTVRKQMTVKLDFSLPQGTHKLRLYVICDSYVGADHDIALDPIEVAEGEESDEDDDESDEDMKE